VVWGEHSRKPTTITKKLEINLVKTKEVYFEMNQLEEKAKDEKLLDSPKL
jgi:hypothetical protein